MPLVKCPTCGKENEYTDNEFRPFCSGRCQLTDLGAWADEQFALPDESTPLTEEEMEKVEQALEAKARANED